MKRLYKCKAWYDEHGLYSYKTHIIRILNINDDAGHILQPITMYNYRSSTTLLHIRKYIRLLNEECKQELADKVQRLYDYAKVHKKDTFIYMTYGGKISK